MGGLSAVLILSDQDNFGVDFDNYEFDLDINNSTLKVENISFSLPFNLTNVGYFELENLQIGVDLVLNYSHIDGGGPGINETRIVKILEMTQDFGDIDPYGGSLSSSLEGYNSSFLHDNFPDPITEIDWFRTPPTLIFYANITISLDYSLGMHSLSITALDIEVGNYTRPF
ncbi:MAG: hypothetical protein ACFFA0_13165 [Promethearchaeota archaeon]